MQRTLLIATATGLLTLAGWVHAAQTPSMNWQQGLSRTDLVHQDLGAADREVLQARVDFDPGVTSPKHSHPGVEIAYVISRTFEYQLEGRAPVTLKAGDSLFIPAGVTHVARNVGSEKGSELATYIVEKQRPLLQLQQQYFAGVITVPSSRANLFIAPA